MIHTHGHMVTWSTHMVTWSTYMVTWPIHMVTWPTHMVTWPTQAHCNDYAKPWQLQLSTTAWVPRSWSSGTVSWWPIFPPPCTPALNPWSTVARTMSSLQSWWWRYVRRRSSSTSFPSLLNMQYEICPQLILRRKCQTLQRPRNKGSWCHNLCLQPRWSNVSPIDISLLVTGLASFIPYSTSGAYCKWQ